MEVVGLVLYNLVLLEFLIMAAMAWLYDGLATRGTGKFFGPFCLLAAVILMTGDARALGVMIPGWFPWAIWIAMTLLGMRVTLHMLVQMYVLRREGIKHWRKR
jgi:hypothetical protein